MNIPCTSHVHEFTHLTLDELDDHYDLGFKFQQSESDKFAVNPSSGVRAWAEPLLILYVSVKHPDLHDDFTPRLCTQATLRRVWKR